MSTLKGRLINDTYKQILKMGVSANAGVSTTLTAVQTGDGEATAIKISKNAMQINGALGITTSVSVSGELRVTGDVCASAYYGSGRHLTSVVVAGDTSVSSLVVTNTATIGGTLSVGGAVNLLSTATVSGAAGFLGSVRVSGTTTIEGAATFKDSVSVSGNANIGGTATIAGAASIGGALSVGGAVHLASTLTVASNASIGGTLSVGGAVNLASTLTVAGAVQLGSTLSVAGEAHLQDAVSLASTLVVGGKAEFDDDVCVSGNTVLVGNLTVGGTVTITGNTTLTGNLGVGGTARVSGNTSLEGQLQLTKSAAAVVCATAINGITSVSLNFGACQNFRTSVTAGHTLAKPIGCRTGQTGSIFLTQQGGSGTMAYNADFKFIGGTDPTLSTDNGAVDRLDYIIVSASSDGVGGDIQMIISQAYA